MARKPKSEDGMEKAFEREFKDSPSSSASLNGDAAIIVAILRRWYGDEAGRIAKQVAEALK